MLTFNRKGKTVNELQKEEENIYLSKNLFWTVYTVVCQ